MAILNASINSLSWCDMDIFTHAVAGAASGAVFGYPVTGAVIAVVPDVVLIGKRRLTPPPLYDQMHNLLYISIASLTVLLLSGGIALASTVFLALLSHLVLDAVSHGGVWAPPLLYPFNDTRFALGLGEEWEWFNDAWFEGLILTLMWVTVCLSITILLT